MKQKLILPIFIGLTIIAQSCVNISDKKEGEEDKETTGQEEKKSGACTYSYNESLTELNWTAFKFTEKTGVKGKFDEFHLSGGLPNEEISGMLNDIGFVIPVSSLNTANPDRDGKIRKFFFGNLKSPEVLKGKVSKAEGDNASGKIEVLLTMNEMEQSLNLNYRVSGDTLIIEGMLNLDNWGAQEGIKALNKECEQLHTGADGKSVLWSEIDIEIRSILDKNCD